MLKRLSVATQRHPTNFDTHRIEQFMSSLGELLDCEELAQSLGLRIAVPELGVGIGEDLNRVLGFRLQMQTLRDCLIDQLLSRLCLRSKSFSSSRVAPRLRRNAFNASSIE